MSHVSRPLRIGVLQVLARAALLILLIGTASGYHEEIGCSQDGRVLKLPYKKVLVVALWIGGIAFANRSHGREL